VQWQLASYHRYWADADYWAGQKGFNEFSACWNGVERELIAIGKRCATTRFEGAVSIRAASSE